MGIIYNAKTKIIEFVSHSLKLSSNKSGETLKVNLPLILNANHEVEPFTTTDDNKEKPLVITKDNTLGFYGKSISTGGGSNFKYIEITGTSFDCNTPLLNKELLDIDLLYYSVNTNLTCTNGPQLESSCQGFKWFSIKSEIQRSATDNNQIIVNSSNEIIIKQTVEASCLNDTNGYIYHPIICQRYGFLNINGNLTLGRWIQFAMVDRGM